MTSTIILKQNNTSGSAPSAGSLVAGEVAVNTADGVLYTKHTDGTVKTVAPVNISNLPIIRPSLLLDFANSKTIDPRITFTRASTATYTGADGLIKNAASGEARFDYNPITGESLGLLIEEQRTNLLTYSENFDNAAWAKAGLTVAINSAIAPDGTLTADKIVESATNGGHYIEMGGVTTVTNTSLTFSFYVKAVEKTNNLYVQIYDSNTANYLRITIDLGNKSFVSSASAGTASLVSGSITIASNDWLRVTISGIPASSNSGSLYACRISFLKNDNSNLIYTGDGTSGIYLWGAQLEQGAFATSYIPSADSFTSRASTGTFIGSNGLIQSAATNVARYNYNPLNLALPPKLLLEPASTNLLTYSEQFDNAVWENAGGNTGIAVTANNTTSPDGNTTADRITNDAGAISLFYYNVPVTASSTTDYTVSIFVKAGTATKFTFNCYYPNNSEDNLQFDLTTGTYLGGGTTNNQPSITSVGNGWYRISYVLTRDSTGSRTSLLFRGWGFSGATRGAGVIGEYYYAWGAQLEQGAFPTSYIPTTSAQVTRAADVSSSAQATRAADNAVMTGTNFSSWFNQSEGTVLCTSDSHATATTNASIFAFYDNPSSGNLVDAWHQTDNNLITRVRTNSQDTIVTVPAVLSNNVKHIMSIGYKSTDSYFINNGTSGLASATAFSFSNAITNLSLGMNQIGTWQMNGHIAKIAYYPKRLSNAELQSITTQ
jgi:protein tyrosine phosphatase (PTP) superfamily phosphohydrolase (DUF442 family)